MGAANIPCSDIYAHQQLGWGLALYIYACLIYRMDSPVMGSIGEPYFTCNVLIPHPMIHLLLSTLPWPGLRVYTSCVVRDMRSEARGTGCEVWGICTGRGARGMRHVVCGTGYVVCSAGQRAWAWLGDLGAQCMSACLLHPNDTSKQPSFQNSAESTIVLLKILNRNNIQTTKTRFEVLL